MSIHNKWFKKSYSKNVIKIFQLKFPNSDMLLHDYLLITYKNASAVFKQILF